MKKNVTLVLLFFLAGIYLSAQEPARLFPQNIDYGGTWWEAYETDTLTPAVLLSMYEKWKEKLLRECNGMYRVIDNEDEVHTRSEGMGYGMLLSAYFGEKDIFDGLFQFYKNKRTEEAKGIMGWEVGCEFIRDRGSATDGDIDVAFALIVAYYQWGGNYINEAKNILSILKEHYFVKCEDIEGHYGGPAYVMYPGSNRNGTWGGCNLTDISYYSPAYFRVFADETNDAFWDTVANDSYVILNNAANHPEGDPNNNTKLVPDWQRADGTPGGSGRADYYGYDACRVPWRISLDLLWNSSTKASTWLHDIAEFARPIGPKGIKDGYNLDGTEHEDARWNNSSFIGGFACAMLFENQNDSEAWAGRLLNRDGTTHDDDYYNLSLRCLYALTLTGNFWEPRIPYEDCSNSDLWLHGITIHINETENYCANYNMTVAGDNTHFVILGNASKTDGGNVTMVSGRYIDLEDGFDAREGCSFEASAFMPSPSSGDVVNPGPIGPKEKDDSKDSKEDIPKVFSCSQNFPNPLNTGTTIKYGLPKSVKTSLVIYNLNGQKVKTLVNAKESAGYKSVKWDGCDSEGTPVPQGVYFYVLKAGSEFTAKKKMIKLK